MPPICELLSVQDAAIAPQVPRWGQMSSGVAPSNISVGGSPFTYQNSLSGPCTVIVQGGTVTTISYSRDGVSFFVVGLLAGMFHLGAGDFLRVVYVLVPTMTLIPF